MNQSSKKKVAVDYDLDTEERDDAVIGKALRWSLVLIVFLGVVGATVAYIVTRPKEGPAAKERKTADVKERVLPSVEIPVVTFRNITREAGIDFEHENGATGEKLLPETMGGGCAFLDYDGDGDQDILFVNSDRWPWDKAAEEQPATMKLYQNDGAGMFEDATQQAGLDVTFYGMGAAIGDIDNDGDVDVFISAVGDNHLYRNDKGTFVDITGQAGVVGRGDQDEQQWSTSCAFFDYNNDGLLDLFVCNYVKWTKEIDLQQDFKLTGSEKRAYGPPRSFQATYPLLYLNQGGGNFKDVSREAGVRVTNANLGGPRAKSLGVVPADLDRDGWIDLVVANDTVENLLFRNEQGKRFTDVGRDAGISVDSRGLSTGAMGIDVAPFRNNRQLGIAIGNFANEMTSLYVAQKNPWQFFDAAMATGLGPQTQLELTFGLFFFDCDLDGRLDLLEVNGHLEEEINQVRDYLSYEQAPQLFYNGGINKSAEFIPMPAEKVGQDFSKPMVGRGAAFADIDNDGDLDVLLTTTGRAPRLLRNELELGHHWLRLQLQGTKSNRSAIGAWVEVHCGDRVLPRPVMPSRSYLSQMELPVTVGLGKTDRVDKVTVRWPSGKVQELAGPKVNQTHLIVEE